MNRVWQDLSLFCVSYPFTTKCQSEVLGAISWTMFLSLQRPVRVWKNTFLYLPSSDGCVVGIVQGTDLVDNQLIFCFALHKDNLPALMLSWPSPHLKASQGLVVWLHCFLWCPFLSLVKLPGLNLQFLSNSSYSPLVITGFFAVQLLSIHTLFLGLNQFV